MPSPRLLTPLHALDIGIILSTGELVPDLAFFAVAEGKVVVCSGAVRLSVWRAGSIHSIREEGNNNAAQLHAQ